MSCSPFTSTLGYNRSVRGLMSVRGYGKSRRPHPNSFYGGFDDSSKCAAFNLENSQNMLITLETIKIICKKQFITRKKNAPSRTGTAKKAARCSRVACGSRNDDRIDALQSAFHVFRRVCASHSLCFSLLGGCSSSLVSSTVLAACSFHHARL